MNKYERALKKVVKETNGTAIEMLLLLELVERATPKKVIDKICPICGQYLIEYEAKVDYCDDCGQALDWSE